MNKVYIEIENLINKALSSLGIDFTDYIIERPADSSNGDYACNVAMRAFPLAKDIAKSPKNLSEMIIKIIEKELSDNIEKVEVAGPGFINFYLSKKFLIQNMFELRKLNSLGNARKKISLEHTQINPNKEPHIGHLRNACIGDSLSKILTFAGNDVTVQYYQNDVGQQIASIVLAYKRQYVPIKDISLDNCEEVLSWASLAYVDIERRISDSIDLKVQKEEIQKQIASLVPSSFDVAVSITNAILKATLTLLSKLSIEYDLIVRESEILKNNLWQDTFKLLENSGNFYKSVEGERTGCWMVRMSQGDDKVIVRSSGIPTYTGNDIAYHLWKFGILNDFKYELLKWGTQEKDLYATNSFSVTNYGKVFNRADSIVNVIDTTQTYPQESVKEALRSLGYSNYADNYRHVNYGFVFLKDSNSTNPSDIVKMSGRKGTVVTISSFIDTLKTSLIDRFGDFKAVDLVVLGAIKFELLKYDTYQDVVFDINAALDQKGFSGPYIQYTYARAMSVMSKGDYTVSRDVDFSFVKIAEVSIHEIDLLKLLFGFEDVILRSSIELAPHYICKYLFDLSKMFNTFYNSSKIIGSANEDFRLELTYSVSFVLAKLMHLLGIPSPESLR